MVTPFAPLTRMKQFDQDFRGLVELSPHFGTEDRGVGCDWSGGSGGGHGLCDVRQSVVRQMKSLCQQSDEE